MPSYSRLVEQGTIYPSGHSADVSPALKFLSPAADPPVPWQRVVSSAGKISSRVPGMDGAARQSEALQAEDVETLLHFGTLDPADLNPHQNITAAIMRGGSRFIIAIFISIQTSPDS
ncbi:hypothetical protein H4582DRAFT_2172057 [Lactarius indigo]|nr:hypothetical protein H4582DRAFT_2172057 [Lactarius indigo]